MLARVVSVIGLSAFASTDCKGQPDLLKSSSFPPQAHLISYQPPQPTIVEERNVIENKHYIVRHDGTEKGIANARSIIWHLDEGAKSAYARLGLERPKEWPIKIEVSLKFNNEDKRYGYTHFTYDNAGKLQRIDIEFINVIGHHDYGVPEHEMGHAVFELVLKRKTPLWIGEGFAVSNEKKGRIEQYREELGRIAKDYRYHIQNLEDLISYKHEYPKHKDPEIAKQYRIEFYAKSLFFYKYMENEIVPGKPERILQFSEKAADAPFVIFDSPYRDKMDAAAREALGHTLKELDKGFKEYLFAELKKNKN